jgi:predicted transcriptional regulator
MKQHRGMRPHDIVVLLKVATKGTKPWLVKDIAFDLGISQSEVSESLHRSVQAGFISESKRLLMKGALLDFLKYGLKYVYPQRPGAIVRGIPTSHSAPPLNKEIVSDEQYVWPYAEGTMRGQSIEPLHKSVPKACLKDKKLYELLALADALRVGKARERSFAMEELDKRIK